MGELRAALLFALGFRACNDDSRRFPPRPLRDRLAARRGRNGRASLKSALKRGAAVPRTQEPVQVISAPVAAREVSRSNRGRRLVPREASRSEADVQTGGGKGPRALCSRRLAAKRRNAV